MRGGLVRRTPQRKGIGAPHVAPFPATLIGVAPQSTGPTLDDEHVSSTLAGSRGQREHGVGAVVLTAGRIVACMLVPGWRTLRRDLPTSAGGSSFMPHVGR
jgi:hypothetical protein